MTDKLFKKVLFNYFTNKYNSVITYDFDEVKLIELSISEKKEFIQDFKSVLVSLDPTLTCESMSNIFVEFNFISYVIEKFKKELDN